MLEGSLSKSSEIGQKKTENLIKENTLEAASVLNNEEARRFEIILEGHTAVLTHRKDGDTLDLRHTVVPEELKGHGLGNKLVKTALDYAQKMNLKVIPTCPFVQTYLRRHPEYIPLVP